MLFPFLAEPEYDKNTTKYIRRVHVTGCDYRVILTFRGGIIKIIYVFSLCIFSNYTVYIAIKGTCSDKSDCKNYVTSSAKKYLIAEQTDHL